MAEPWCDHCDLPLATCVHGNPPTTKYDADVLYRSGPTIAAQFGGTECVGCGERIVKDEEITRTSEGWAHAREVQDPPVADVSIFEGI